MTLPRRRGLVLVGLVAAFGLGGCGGAATEINGGGRCSSGGGSSSGGASSSSGGSSSGGSSSGASSSSSGGSSGASSGSGGVTSHSLTIVVGSSGSTAPSAGTHSYPAGTGVKVTATPSTGWAFGGWSGATTGAANPVTIAMDEDKTLTASFSPAGGCQHGQVHASEVLWIGDSWIQIPGDQHDRVRDLARAAGTIGASEDYVDLAVSGSPIATIVSQYDTQEAGPTKVKVLIMDGGGIDTIFAGGSEASVSSVVDTFERHLARVASDGTVRHVIYFLYPELPTIAGVAALRPVMKQACAASAVPCHFLDLQPLWVGHPEYTGGDSIHPSSAGGKVIGDAIWAIMQESCIAQ